MAEILRLKDCQTDGLLPEIAQQLLDEVALVRDELLVQVNAINPADASAAVQAMNEAFDHFLAQAPIPLTNEEVSGQVGLPTEEPSELEDESRLEALGLVLVRGILYAQGNNQNIENFRRLYFAVGSNLTTFLDLVQGTENLILVQTRLVVKVLPSDRTDWTVTDAREIFQNDAIEAVYRAADARFYAVVPQFLNVNVSVAQVAQQFGIPRDEVVTQVFWLREVEQNTARINQLTGLGIQGDELTSILTGEPVKDIRPSTISSLRDNLIVKTSKATSQIEFLNGRYSRVDDAVRSQIRSEILFSVEEARALILLLERKVRFAPILLVRPEDISDFLVLNSQNDLSYLFSEKRSVSSIDFEVSREELRAIIARAARIPAGSNTVSSLLSNQQPVLVDSDVNSSNASWTRNECARIKMSSELPMRYEDLQTSYACLRSSTLLPPAVPTSSVPVVGYDGYDSPSSVMFRRVDFFATLKIQNLFDEIIAVADPLSKTLSEALKVLIAFLKASRAAVDAVLGAIIDKINAVVSQIEALISRYYSYFGTATLDSSILKCAFGFELRPTLPFLSDIEPAVEILRRTLKNLLAQAAQVVGDYMSRLVCIPINFLNDLTKGATAYLPALCRVDSFKLPAELESLLVELRDSFTLESVNIRQFGRSLVRIEASVQALPAKLENFREDLVCNQTPLNSRFMKSMREQVDASFGTNYLAALTEKLLPPRG